ncbi:unnamed protein product [Urochloa humidicola]
MLELKVSKKKKKLELLLPAWRRARATASSRAAGAAPAQRRAGGHDDLLVAPRRRASSWRAAAELARAAAVSISGGPGCGLHLPRVAAEEKHVRPEEEGRLWRALLRAPRGFGLPVKDDRPWPAHPRAPSMAARRRSLAPGRRRRAARGPSTCAAPGRSAEEPRDRPSARPLGGGARAQVPGELARAPLLLTSQATCETETDGDGREAARRATPAVATNGGSGDGPQLRKNPKCRDGADRHTAAALATTRRQRRHTAEQRMTSRGGVRRLNTSMSMSSGSSTGTAPVSAMASATCSVSGVGWCFSVFLIGVDGGSRGWG